MARKAPLLVVDAPHLLFRSFFALPESITDEEGRPVNALLGSVNFLTRMVSEHKPRAVVACFGPDAAEYRTELYPDYHAHREPIPDVLDDQFALAPDLYEAFGWTSKSDETLEADDLLHSFAAGGRRRWPRADPDRRPRPLPVRHRPSVQVLYISTGGGAARWSTRRRSSSVTGSRRSWCRTSSLCAATPRTASGREGDR